MKLRISFKHVMVEKHDIVLDVPDADVWRYKENPPLLRDSDLDEIVRNLDGVPEEIRLHHSHWKKLQAGGMRGWFDWKVRKAEK